MLTRSFCLLFISSVLLSCSSYVGSTIEVPEVPLPPGTRGRLDASVALTGIKDVRETVASGREDVQFTEPTGATGATVERALEQAFREKGIIVSGGAQTSVWGEIRRWRTQVSTTTSSNIRSEASLFIEVQDQNGRPIYSGTYHGSRASQFPIASQRDIQSSLGIAMSQAIGQLLEDEEFLAALWRN